MAWGGGSALGTGLDLSINETFSQARVCLTDRSTDPCTEALDVKVIVEFVGNGVVLDFRVEVPQQ